MEKVREQLVAMGMSVGNLDDEQVRGVAKAVGLDVPAAPPKKREVRVENYTTKGTGETYLSIQTDNYVLEGQTTKSGNPRTVKGLFIRAELLPQVLEDLKVAQQLLEARSDDED